MPIKQILDLGWECPMEPKAPETTNPVPKPQREPTLRRSERLKKKLETIQEVEEEQTGNTEINTQVDVNWFKLAATTTIVVLSSAAIKTLEIYLF